jgi:DNA-binding response OmpR family regulator
VKRTLLIAESGAELGDIYRSFLRESGFEVNAASDGLSCLEQLHQASPAVLVLGREPRWGGADGVLAWLRSSVSSPRSLLS